MQFLRSDLQMPVRCLLSLKLSQCLPNTSQRKTYFSTRIRSPWLLTARYSVTTKRNTSRKLFKHLPTPRNPIFDPKIAKNTKIRKIGKFGKLFAPINRAPHEGAALFPCLGSCAGVIFPFNFSFNLQSPTHGTFILEHSLTLNAKSTPHPHSKCQGELAT